MVLLLLSLPASAAISPEALVRSLAQPVPARTAFIEVRFMNVLDRPLILRGELAWLGGSHLQRTVVSPYRERSEINSGQITVTRSGQAPRHFSLDRAPQLRDLLISFTALLAGRPTQLLQRFEARVWGNPTSWTLNLRPRDAKVARQIQALNIDGDGTALRCMRVDDTDGDTSFTLLGVLGHARLPKPLTPAALVRLCAAAP